MQKIQLIEQKINSVYSTHKYIKQAKNLRFESYKKEVLRLEEIPLEKIETHNFSIEVLNFAFKLEKLDYIEKKLAKNIKVEKHVYAPELNKILIFNQVIKAKGVQDYAGAVLFLVDNFPIEVLKKIKK